MFFQFFAIILVIKKGNRAKREKRTKMGEKTVKRRKG